MKASVTVCILNQTIAVLIVLSAICQVSLCILGKVIVVDEIISRIIRRVYVPTDFDTIEKAFSGVKTAEKGIKQGLSRPVYDFESPFSFCSIVVFSRTRPWQHRGV